MLQADQVAVGYGRRDVVCEFSLTVGRGECVHLAGVNGAGKTTLLRVLAGIQAPRAGTIRLPDPPQIGYAPTGFAVLGRVSARTYLGQLLALQRLSNPSGEIERLAAHFQLRPGLDEAVDRLSAGNRQIVNLIQAFAGRRELLILDEPFTGLAPHARDALRGCVAAALGAGAAVVYTDHANHHLAPHRTAWLGPQPQSDARSDQLVVRDAVGARQIRKVPAAGELRPGDTVVGWVE